MWIKAYLHKNELEKRFKPEPEIVAVNLAAASHIHYAADGYVIACDKFYYVVRPLDPHHASVTRFLTNNLEIIPPPPQIDRAMMPHAFDRWADGLRCRVCNGIREDDIHQL